MFIVLLLMWFNYPLIEAIDNYIIFEYVMSPIGMAFSLLLSIGSASNNQNQKAGLYLFNVFFTAIKLLSVVICSYHLQHHNYDTHSIVSCGLILTIFYFPVRISYLAADKCVN